MAFWKNLFTKPEAIIPKASPQIMPSPPKIGIAFGGGGFKGAAHIGVLKVLAKHNIKADMVAGTSVGSAVAALYASGYSWDMIELIFKKMDLESLVRLRPGRKGLISGNAYAELIHTCTKGKKIEQMDIPLKIVAVDLISWKKVVFDQGDTAIAVQASSAIPGVFTPVRYKDMLLVDGFLLNNCPSDIVRSMGADIVLAIDLSSPDYREPKNMIEIITRSLEIATAANEQIEADLILRPIPYFMEMLKADKISEAMDLGEQAANEHIDELIAMIDGFGKV